MAPVVCWVVVCWVQADRLNAHRLRSAPMQGGRAATAAPSFTVEIGHLHGYEGGGSGQSHPENADPDQRVDKMELSPPY